MFLINNSINLYYFHFPITSIYFNSCLYYNLSSCNPLSYIYNNPKIYNYILPNYYCYLPYVTHIIQILLQYQHYFNLLPINHCYLPSVTQQYASRVFVYIHIMAQLIVVSCHAMKSCQVQNNIDW